MSNICDIYIDLNNRDVYKIIGYSELCRSISLADNKGNQINRHVDTLFDFKNQTHEIILKTSEYEIIKDVCEAGHDFINWYQNDDEWTKSSLESTFNNWLDNTKKYMNVYIFSQKYFRENKKAILSTKYFFKAKEGVKND
jgi:hypothetical protein